MESEVAAAAASASSRVPALTDDEQERKYDEPSQKHTVPLAVRTLKRVASAQREEQTAAAAAVAAAAIDPSHSTDHLPQSKRARTGVESSSSMVGPMSLEDMQARLRTMQVNHVASKLLEKLPEWRTTKMMEEATRMGLTQVYLYADMQVAHRELLRQVIPVLRKQINARFGEGVLHIFWKEHGELPDVFGNTPAATLGSIRCDWTAAAKEAKVQLSAPQPGLETAPEITDMLLRHKWAAATAAMVDEWLQEVPSLQALRQADANLDADIVWGQDEVHRCVIENEWAHENLRRSQPAATIQFVSTMNVGPDPAQQSAARAELAAAHRAMRQLEHRRHRFDDPRTAMASTPGTYEDLGRAIANQWNVIRAIETRIRLRTTQHTLRSCACPRLQRSFDGVTYMPLNACALCMGMRAMRG
jgi:hypothetical protein